MVCFNEGDPAVIIGVCACATVGFVLYRMGKSGLHAHDHDSPPVSPTKRSSLMNGVNSPKHLELSHTHLHGVGQCHSRYSGLLKERRHRELLLFAIILVQAIVFMVSTSFSQDSQHPRTDSRVVLESLESTPHIPAFDCTSLSKGREMRGKYAVFTGITMNGAILLPRAIDMIEAMGSCFADYDVVILENDSKDDTKKLLKDWQSRNSGRIITETRDFNRTKRPSIQWMADLRNRALELAYMMSYATTIRHEWSADVYINIDMDLGSLDMEGFVDAADAVISGYKDGPPVVAAACNGFHQFYVYKDTFAFRNCNVRWDARIGNMHDPVIARSMNRSVHYFQRSFLGDLPPFEVDSAFGGIAIYRAQEVFGQIPKQSPAVWHGDKSEPAFRKYTVATSPEGNVFTNYSYAADIGMHSEYPCQYGAGGFKGAEDECEHVPFHACVNARARKHGILPMRVFPAWGVWYGAGPSGAPIPRKFKSLYAQLSESPFSAKVPPSSPDQTWKFVGPGPLECGCDMMLPNACGSVLTDKNSDSRSWKHATSKGTDAKKTSSKTTTAAKSKVMLSSSKGDHMVLVKELKKRTTKTDA